MHIIISPVAPSLRIQRDGRQWEHLYSCSWYKTFEKLLFIVYTRTQVTRMTGRSVTVRALG